MIVRVISTILVILVLMDFEEDRLTTGSGVSLFSFIIISSSQLSWSPPPSLIISSWEIVRRDALDSFPNECSMQ